MDETFTIGTEAEHGEDEIAFNGDQGSHLILTRQNWNDNNCPQTIVASFSGSDPYSTEEPA